MHQIEQAAAGEKGERGGERETAERELTQSFDR